MKSDLFKILKILLLGIFLNMFLVKFANSFESTFKQITCNVSINEKINKTLFLEIADTEKKRSYGLMNREVIKANHGMLFVWKKSDNRTFWMKNTLLNLDLFFINLNGLIVEIHRNAKALDLRTIKSKKKANFVLEMDAGKLKSKVGDKLTCPFIKSEIY